LSLVSIIKGNDPEVMVRQAIDLLGGLSPYVKEGQRVFIKPNVCGGVFPQNSSIQPYCADEGEGVRNLHTREYPQPRNASTYRDHLIPVTRSSIL